MIDRGVGLNRALDQSARDFRLQRPGESRDDAPGKRSIESERVSDRQNLLPDKQLVGIAELHRSQLRGRRVNLDHRQIIVRVAAKKLRLIFLAVRKRDIKLPGVL